MENVRNHVNVKLLTQWDGRRGNDREAEFSEVLFSENLITIRKLELKFNKLIYVGSIYSIYRQSICMNFTTNICYRYITKNVKLYVHRHSYIASSVMTFMNK